MQLRRVGSSGDTNVYGFSLNPPFPLDLSLTFFSGCVFWAVVSAIGAAWDASLLLVASDVTGSTGVGVSSDGSSDNLNLFDSGPLLSLSFKLSASRLRSLGMHDG